MGFMCVIVLKMETDRDPFILMVVLCWDIAVVYRSDVFAVEMMVLNLCEAHFQTTIQCNKVHHKHNNDIHLCVCTNIRI